MGGIPMRSAGISTSDRERTGIREVPFFRAGYAGCMECTVHLLASMPVCYIYRQQGGRQPSRPMAEGTSR